MKDIINKIKERKDELQLLIDKEANNYIRDALMCKWNEANHILRLISNN